MKIIELCLRESLSLVQLSELTKITHCFQGSIICIKNEEKISMKKILPLVSTKLNKNDIIKIQIQGEREEEFEKSLRAFFKENLEEENDYEMGM